MKNQEFDIQDNPSKIVQLLQNGPVYRANDLPKNMPKRCIVAFYLGKKLLHVGRTRDSRRYLCDAFFHPDSFLAMKLARIVTGRQPSTLGPKTASVKSPVQDAIFDAIHQKQRARIVKATVRVVEIIDDTKLNLLHRMAESALECPYPSR